LEIEEGYRLERSWHLDLAYFFGFQINFHSRVFSKSGVPPVGVGLDFEACEVIGTVSLFEIQKNMLNPDANFFPS